MKRPLSVSIISWIIIIVAVVATIPLVHFLMHNTVSNQSISLIHRSIYLGLVVNVINIIAAIGALKGHNWGRWLYTIVFVLMVIHAIVVLHFTALILVSFILPIIFVIVFFLPGANKYFSSSVNSAQE